MNRVREFVAVMGDDVTLAAIENACRRAREQGAQDEAGVSLSVHYFAIAIPGASG